MWIDDINNAEPKLMSVLLYMMLSNHNTINLPLYVYQRVLVWTVPTGTKNEDVNKAESDVIQCVYDEETLFGW